MFVRFTNGRCRYKMNMHFVPMIVHNGEGLLVFNQALGDPLLIRDPEVAARVEAEFDRIIDKFVGDEPWQRGQGNPVND